MTKRVHLPLHARREKLRRSSKDDIMHLTLSRYASLFLLSVSPGCAGSAAHDPPNGAPPVATELIAPDAVPLDVEQAERDVDLNRNVPAARALLAERIATGALASDARDDATFAVARASHELGDDEGATVAVERLLAQHADDARWPLGEASSKLLRDLVTHEDPPPAPDFEQAVVAPFAHALIGYFSEVSKGPVHADVVTIGGGEATSARLGTFNVAGALHQERIDHCASCGPIDSDVISIVRGADWTSIPALRSRAADALTVVYFTLDDRIPDRYDDLLAMPASEITRRLDRGEAFIVARERPGAPPVVLVAAPTTVQLRTVEEALATQTTVPLKPLEVKVSGSIDPKDIQRAVRSDFGRFRSCYMSLLAHAPAAEGRVTVSFAIDAGLPTRLRVDFDPALRDDEFQTCMTVGFSALHFPVRPGVVTVIYPISFSPTDR
jgi:hypothetical protein